MPTKSNVPSHRVKPLRTRASGSNENSKEKYNKSLINKVHKQFETEFKILTGSQEYNVQRIKNSFIVRPCSSTRPTLTTSSMTFSKIERKKSSEEVPKEKERTRTVSAKQVCDASCAFCAIHPLLYGHDRSFTGGK
jgi:tRNA A37 methylthiotransferase MiaB